MREFGVTVSAELGQNLDGACLGRGELSLALGLLSFTYLPVGQLISSGTKYNPS